MQTRRNPQPTWSAFALLFVLVLLGAGCTTSNRILITPAPEDADRVLSEGCTLLHSLLQKNRAVDKILFIKGGPRDFKALIVDIATACAEGVDVLERLAEDDPQISLEGAGLPMVEGATRTALEQTSTRTLLGASGVEFRIRLIVEQIKATSYASHLAGVLAGMESDTHPDRASTLMEMEERFDGLHTRLIERLMEG